jgi:superfamily II DNA/RNA helicase
VIFTEYRDTLDAVSDVLRARRRIGAIHGGVAPDVRRSVVDAFNHGALDVLVATDAAGEGLNLHRRCRLVIDIELPWNPRRLEQRVGRVDRLGQRRTVHAIRMFHPGTIEQRVLERLQLRARCADEALESGASETDMARAVFEANAPAIAPLPAIQSDRIAAAETEAQLATNRRRVECGAVSSSSRCWSARHAGPLVLVHRLTVKNIAGIAIGDVAVAHRVQLAAAPLNRREWRCLIETVDAAIQSLVSRTAIAPLQHAAVGPRIAVIRERLLQQRAARTQRSLFDGRVDAEAQGRAQVIASLDASLARIVAVIASPVDIEATRLELIAAWSEHLR